MGRVKNRPIKRIAKILLSLYPDKFNINFEHNKNQLKQIPELQLSKKERNKIAGYIIKLIKLKKLETKT